MWQTGNATDFLDLMAQLDTFLTATGSAFNLSYAGTGNGKLTAYSGGSASVAESFAIVAINSTTFSVTGSISGALSNATVGTPYTGTKVQFLLTAGGTAFVSGDKFTISTAPKYVQQRNNRAIGIVGGYNEPYLAFNYRRARVTGYDSNASSLPAQLGCKLNTSASIYTVLIDPGTSAAYAPSAFDLQYSDDGASWTTLQSWSSLTTGWTAGTDRIFTVTSPVSHQWWRINVTAAPNTPSTIGRVQFQDATGTISHLDSIWKAPGNDGAQSIYFGVQAFAHVAANYYNWRIMGATGFTQYASIDAQPGACGLPPVMPLWNNTIPYWFIADGSRVKVIAKVSTSYESIYMGFIDQYLSPTQYPYPLAIGGSFAPGPYDPADNSSTWRYSNTSTGRSMFTKGQANPNSGDPYCNFRLRKQDGTWHGYTSAGNSNSYVRSIYPSTDVMTDLRPNLDSSLATFPYILNDQSPAACFGEINGVSNISGYSNGSENIVTIAGVDHLVVQDLNRTTSISYSAFKLN